MRAVCVLLLDGLGDRGYPELGGMSAGEAAVTPALDALCARGSCGLLWPLGPGRAPSSEVAHWRMLGYATDEFPGRAVLEALGRGLDVHPGDVLAYAALRPAERRGGKLWLTGRPGPEDDEDCRKLVGALAEVELDGLAFSLHHLAWGESILRICGGASDALTDTDSFFRDRDPVLRPLPAAPEAAETAEVVETWTRRAFYTLLAHPVNARRGSEGRAPLTIVTLKWWGRLRPAPRFAGRHGLSGAFVGASPFLRGLARAVGLEYVAVSETDDPAADLGARLEAAAQLLDVGATFVWIHLKALDEAGHAKDPRARVRVLEAIDAVLDRLDRAPFSEAAWCVTGDHATPAAPEVIHSGDPVPFVLGGPGVRADRVERFGELSCAQGVLGHLRGEDVMPVLLNAADRPLFLGSRPTPVSGAAGYPATPEPLEV